MADANQGVNNIDCETSRVVDILENTFGETLTRDVIHAVVESCGGNLDISAEHLMTMINDSSLEVAESLPSSTRDAVTVVQTPMSNVNDSTIQQSVIAPHSQLSYAGAFKKTGAIPKPKSNMLNKVESPRIISSGCDDQLNKIKHYHDMGYRTMIIMRGAPGSGKSFLANHIVNMTAGTDSGFTHIFSADDYFVIRGGYDKTLIGQAHQWTRDKVRFAIEQALSPIIVDNTNTQIWEMEAYVRDGVNSGYFIEVVQPKTPWATNVSQLARRNVHKVPRDKIERMLDRFENIKSAGILAEFRLSYPPNKHPPILRDVPLFPETKPLLTFPDDIKKITESNIENTIFPICEPPQLPNASTLRSDVCDQNATIQMTDEFSKLQCNSTNLASNYASTDAPEQEEAFVADLQENIIKVELEWENGEDWVEVDNKGNVTENQLVSEPKPQRNKKDLLAPGSSQNLMPLLYQQSEDWNEISKLMPAWDHDSTQFSKTIEDPIKVETISCGTGMEIGDTATHNNNKCLIVSATPRDINYYYMPKLENKIPDKRTLDKSTEANEEHFTDIYRCKNEHKHFLSLCKMFRNVSRDDLKEILDKCHGDVNWAVEIILDSGISDQKQSNDEEIPDVDEASDENCGCLALYNVIPNVEPERNNDNAAMVVNSSPLQVKKYRKDKPGHSESSMQLKRQIEQNVVLSDNHYSEHCLKIRKMRRGELEGGNLPVEEAASSHENSPPIESTSRENSGYISEEDSNSNEPTLNVNLSPHFILFLDDMFGRKGTKYSDNVMPVVNMPMSLLQKLNALWMESYSNQLATQAAYSQILYKEDEEFARALTQAETELAEAGQEPVVPDFKEIMDLDLAQSLYHKDIAEWKKSIPEDIAAKMTRDKLYNLFPDLMPDVLNELLMAHDNNFRATVEVLLISTGQSEVLMEHNGLNKFVMNRELERQKRLLEVEKQKVLDDDEWPVLTKCEEPLDLSSAEKYREKANEHLQSRNVNHNKAQECMRRGMTSIASYYSDVAAYHTRLFEQANSLAASSFIQYHSTYAASTTLDLHFLFVPEAMEALDLFIDHHIQCMRESKDRATMLFIITGRGLHSKGGPKIKPAAKKRLKSRGLTWSELNPGVLLVDVSVHHKMIEELRSM